MENLNKVLRPNNESKITIFHASTRPTWLNLHVLATSNHCDSVDAVQHALQITR